MAVQKVLLIGDDPFGNLDTLGPYRYSLGDHAAAIRRNSDLQLSAFFAPAPSLLEKARNDWHVPAVGEFIDETDLPKDINIAVLYAAPQRRAELVQLLHGVSTILVETPCGLGVADSEAFADLCSTNLLTAAVNGAWRAEPLIQDLIETGVENLIGSVSAATGVYGFGLWDRGVMWIDLISQLLGPISMIQALEDARHIDQPAVPGDQAVSFVMTADLEHQFAQVLVTAIAATNAAVPSYLELIGTTGRLHLTLHHEGTELLHWRADQESTATRGDHGPALDSLYTNIQDVAETTQSPLFPIAEAVEIERLIEAILESADLGGDRYHCR